MGFVCHSDSDNLFFMKKIFISLSILFFVGNLSNLFAAETKPSQPKDEKFEAYKKLQQVDGTMAALEPMIQQGMEGLKRANLSAEAIKEYEKGMRDIMKESMDAAAKYFSEHLTLEEINRLAALQNDPLFQKHKKLAIEYSQVSASSMEQMGEKAMRLMQNLMTKYPPKPSKK